jgi:hypothetical protein
MTTDLHIGADHVMVNGVRYVRENADVTTAVNVLTSMVLDEWHGSPAYLTVKTDDPEFIEAYSRDGHPLFCEVTLYDLFGKTQARTILVLVHQLRRLAGLPEHPAFDSDE